MIDTGFDGYLSLPDNLAEEMGSRIVGTRRAALANGSIIEVQVVRTVVQWFDSPKPVLAMVTQGSILAGMALLRNCRLSMDVKSGGEVTVERIDS